MSSRSKIRHRGGAHHPAAKARIVAVAIGLLVASSCARGRQEPTGYGEPTKRNFTEGCEETLASVADDEDP